MHRWRGVNLVPPAAPGCEVVNREKADLWETIAETYRELGPMFHKDAEECQRVADYYRMPWWRRLFGWRPRREVM